MSNAPFFWKTRPEEQEETLSLVKRGTVTKVGDSAGGRPIYKVEYGKSNLPKGTANLSSALGAHDIRACVCVLLAQSCATLCNPKMLLMFLNFKLNSYSTMDK